MHRRATLLPLLLLCACGSKWGTELQRDMHYGSATIFHSEAVDAATASKVFTALTDAQYNFASNLPEQIDRVNGRLTLRLCNDNEDSIAAIVAAGEKEPAIRYFEGLAYEVSKVLGGEPVDIVLCRKSLDEPFFTVVWKETPK